jgi:hypothetical protein
MELPLYMTVYLFLSGPIRPSAAEVLQVIRTFRSCIDDCKIWVSTWETTEPLDEIAAEVDRLIVSPQPQTDHLRAKTTQAVDAERYKISKPNIYNWCKNAHVGTFLSVQGMTKFFEVGECSDTDIVIRLRSDVLFPIDPEHARSMIANPEYYHVIDRSGSGVHFDEWFGLSSYANMKKVWSFTTTADFESELSRSFNGEEFIRRCVERHNIPIKYIDETKIDISLLRPGGVRVRY